MMGFAEPNHIKGLGVVRVVRLDVHGSADVAGQLLEASGLDGLMDQFPGANLQVAGICWLAGCALAWRRQPAANVNGVTGLAGLKSHGAVAAAAECIEALIVAGRYPSPSMAPNADGLVGGDGKERHRVDGAID